jgi:hypothetical protein
LKKLRFVQHGHDGIIGLLNLLPHLFAADVKAGIIPDGILIFGETVGGCENVNKKGCLKAPFCKTESPAAD